MKKILLFFFLLTMSFGLVAQTKSKSKSRKTSQKPEISNTTSVDDDDVTHKITGSLLSDHAADYIGKKIEVNAMYTDADQAGSWADVQGMTLRPKSFEFEDTYAMINYSDGKNKTGGDLKSTYRRRVTIDGNKINLIILKRWGNILPNSTAIRVIIYGTLINHNTIEVTTIFRDY